MRQERDSSLLEELLGACRWYSQTSKSSGGNMAASRIASTNGTASQSQRGRRTSWQ